MKAVRWVGLVGAVLVCFVLAARGLAGATQRPLVVAFGADWCMQCAIDEQYYPLVRQRWVNLIVIDADEAPETVKAWGVTKLPTYFLLRQDGTTLKTHDIQDLFK